MTIVIITLGLNTGCIVGIFMLVIFGNFYKVGEGWGDFDFQNGNSR